MGIPPRLGMRCRRSPRRAVAAAAVRLAQAVPVALAHQDLRCLRALQEALAPGMVQTRLLQPPHWPYRSGPLAWRRDTTFTSIGTGDPFLETEARGRQPFRLMFMPLSRNCRE